MSTCLKGHYCFIPLICSLFLFLLKPDTNNLIKLNLCQKIIAAGIMEYLRSNNVEFYRVLRGHHVFQMTAKSIFIIFLSIPAECLQLLQESLIFYMTCIVRKPTAQKNHECFFLRHARVHVQSGQSMHNCLPCDSQKVRHKYCVRDCSSNTNLKFFGLVL